MSGEQVCSRCGSLLVAGQCPNCKTNGAGQMPIERKLANRSAYGAIGALLAGALTLFLSLSHLLPWQLAPRKTERWPKHEGPIAQLSELHGRGTIYLVQLTPHNAAYSTDDLAQWLHTRYGLDARSLPPEPLPTAAWNGWRRQYVAELLYAEIKKHHPALAANKDAYLIGLTDADMYSVANRWAFSFTQRVGARSAIISSAELEDRRRFWERPPRPNALKEHLRARMRRVLLKDMAMLYWHLPTNYDPSSLLHQPEDPDLPTEDIYESDIDPAKTQWGQFEGEPCLFFRYSAKTGLQRLPGSLIQTCSKIRSLEDDSTEFFEVDLRLGMMVDRRTDLSIPGVMPISFERALRPGWTENNPFGVSGTDSYDSFLASRDNIYISVVADDAGRTQLVRDPIWFGFLPWTKYIDTEFSGSYYEMHWRTNPYPHYDLRRYDGWDETFLPCSSSLQYCYLNGERDSDGRELRFQRDANRHLQQLTSSDGGWLKILYGPQFQIEQISDSRGQTVRYGYNERNQLTSVTYPSGETLSFCYDDANELTTFSAAPDSKTAPKVLLRSYYRDGLLERQSLADGSTYMYSYGPMDHQQARTAVIKTSEGKVYTIRRFGDISGVWETDTDSKSVHDQGGSTSFRDVKKSGGNGHTQLQNLTRREN